MKNLFLTLILIFSLSGCTVGGANTLGETNTASEPPPVLENINKAEEQVIPSTDEASWVEPLPDASLRVAKKPFGIYITPKNSPVSPERFSGFHTGVDYEIFDNEKDQEVAVRAVCSGELLQKRWVSGYGGLAVASCLLDNQPVVVYYGHLKLESIVNAVGDNLVASGKLGVLGQGFSHETDQERKHLHLGVTRGTNIDIRGYVQAEAELASWIDFRTIVKE